MSKKRRSDRTNVPKKDGLLRHFSDVRKFVMKTTDDPSLLCYLEEIKRALFLTKYGLIFEEHTEEIERILKEKEVELVEEKELAINHGKRLNLLIEGENFGVLRWLTTSYLRKVNVIYVDPPYNTGMKSLNYDDYDYTDPGDAYIHSKWLSFMDKRLRVAYSLLSRNGIMFIQIDEHETGTLLLLCQSIFGQDNVVVLVWPKTDPKFDQNRVEKPFHNIKIVHEYIFVCFKDKNKTTFNSLMMPSRVSNEEYAETPSHMETILKGWGQHRPLKMSSMKFLEEETSSRPPSL